MKKINLLILSVIALLVGACASGSKETKPANYNIVPLPLEVSISEGVPFTLTSATKIVFPDGNEKMQRNAEFLAEFLETSTGRRPAITSATSDKNAIVLALGLEHENAEAYQITVNENLITITGVTEAGVFYGIQTLRKATPIGNNLQVTYEPVTINDAPRFAYRGVHLDVARHFQPVDFIKKYIDLLAIHNVNKFHWHLTEDQGWRIEIKKYPKLTEIGSVRKETVIGKNTGEYDGTPHGGFYTQEEIKEIVKYAEERYITVIPEIDMPGHMLAALAAYPELGCTGGPYEVERTWGVFDDILCAGQEETFQFVEDVLTEVMELFPSEYIHIGGDEAPKVRWEECPRCQAKIKELGLKDGPKHKKEFYLQSYFTERVEKFLNEHGRKLIGWDEILEGQLAPNATVMSWRGMGGGIEAAQLGHDVIMTPNTYCYFDYYQTNNTESEPYSIGGYVPVELVYNFEPVPAELTEEQKKHILGPQANLWTEYIKTPEHVEYMTLPRLSAMCEVQWTQPEKKDYKDFLTRLPQLLALYDKLGYNYATHVFDVQAKLTPNFETNSLNVEFSTIDNTDVYYTLDGTEPTAASTLYEGMFSIAEDAELKAIAIRENGIDSKVFSEKIKVSKATFKPITSTSISDPNYTYGGVNMLVDGLYGNSVNYRTGRWIGFGGRELEAVIDMLEPTEITTAEVRNCVVTGDWIFDASEITIAVSDDNKTFRTVKTETITDAHTDQWQEIVTHSLTFDAVTARYYKIIVKPSVMPEWHPGKGKKAYIFVDEIVLN